jgi:sugar porter (SP) family MFS transporter
MGVAAPVRIAAVAGLAGLLFGFDTAVIAGVTHALRDVFALSPAGLGWTVSSALWGTLVGALVIGRPGDRFGSRDMLRVVGFLYLLSAVGCALAWNLPSFLGFRFVTGFAIGSSSVLAPVYISEIAPAGRRGRLVGLFQINIVVGILVAYCSNFVVAVLVSGAGSWRAKLAATALPALLFCVLLYTIPQSPRWLALRSRFAEAEASLRCLGHSQPAIELAAYGDPRRTPSASAPSALTWTRHRRSILLAIVLAVFNQLSGINAILYYLGDLFAAAGFSTWSADLQSVAVGATNLVATVIGMMLIDRVGRKTLLLAGSVGTAVALGGVTVIMAGGAGRAGLLALLIAFIASFAISQGAVIWVYLSEIFPTEVRARGQAVGSAAHWIMNALIAVAFPLIAARSRAAPFAFFACMMVLQFFAVLWLFPETRGIALEHIDELLRAPRGRLSPKGPGVR